MLGILLLVGFEGCGVYIAERLFSKKSGLTRLWLGLSLGLGMMMWFPSLWAFAIDFTAAAQWLGLALAAGCAAAAHFAVKPDPLARKGSFLGDMPAWMPIALVVPLLVLSGYLQYTHILREVDGALHVGQSTYGDLCLHLGIATGLQNASYPPTYTLLQDALLGYPFLSDAMAASMLLLGTPLALAFTLTGTLMMGLVYLGFVLFAWELTKRRAAVVLAFVFMFINGGLGFLYVLDDLGRGSAAMLKEVFTGFYRTPTNMPDLNLRWVNVICDMMIPQRTLLAGWMMLIPALYMLLDAIREGVRKNWIMLGVWAGAMPMVHTHSFLALGLLSFGAGLYLLIRKRNGEWKKILLGLGFYGCIAVALALPQLLTWTFPQTAGGGSLGFRFNWVNYSASAGGLIDGYFWFWIKNVGLLYLIMVPAALASSPRGRAIACGALAIYVVAELIQFQPNEYDNNKLFYVAYMVMTPLAGHFLVDVWDRMKGLRGRALLAAVFIGACTLSGALSIARETISDYQLFSESEAAAGEFSAEETPEDAVFLTAQQHNNPITALGGRQIVCGTGSYLYYHGLNYAQQAMDCQSMFEDPEANLILFDEYGVDYVYISAYELNGYQVDEEYFARNCTLVFEGEGARIYAWSDDAKALAAKAE